MHRTYRTKSHRFALRRYALNRHALLLLRWIDHANRKPHVSVLGQGHQECPSSKIQYHGAVILIVGRSPVETFGIISAVGTDCGRITASSGRQKHRTGRLHDIVPFRCGNHVAQVISGTHIGVGQRIGCSVPIVGQNDQAINAVHDGLGVTDSRSRASGVEDIRPFLNGQKEASTGITQAVRA